MTNDEGRRKQQAERARRYIDFWHREYGWSGDYLSARLNFQEIPHPDDRPWTYADVQAILTRTEPDA